MKRLSNLTPTFTRKFASKAQLRTFTRIESTFNANDKWTKDKAKIPFIVPSATAGVKLAEKLFRHGYNTNQLGYFFRCMALLLEHFSKNPVPAFVAGNDQFFKGLYNMGIADCISQEIIPTAISTSPGEVYVLVQTFLQFYTAHYKVDVRAVFKYGGKPIDAKYADYVNRAMSAAAAAIGPKETRLMFQESVAPELLGGWVANFSGDTVDETHAIQISSIVSQSEEEEMTAKL